MTTAHPELKTGWTPVEVVQAYLGAFGSGDVEAAVALLREDVTWHIAGDPAVFTIGLRRGRDSMRTWLRGFPDHFSTRAFALSRLLADGDEVIAIGRFRHTLRATGQSAGGTIGLWFTVKDGGIIRCQVLEDSLLLSRAVDPADNVEARQSVKLNGTTYGFSDQGSGTAGQPIVFLHGLGLDRWLFKPQIEALVAEGWRCLSFDAPGHGSSSWRAGWTLDDLADDLALFIDEHLTAPTLFVGHSFGAMVGVRVAARRPDLIGGVVAIGSTPSPEADDRLPEWRALQAVLRSGDYQARRQAFGDLQTRLLSSDWRAAHSETTGNELDLMSSHPPEGIAAAIEAAVLQRGNLHEPLVALKAPLLALTGALDTATPPAVAQEMAKLAPNGRAEIVAGAGHHLPLEAPEAVTERLLNFARASARP